MEYGKRPLFPKAVIQMFRLVVLRQAANGQNQSLRACLNNPFFSGQDHWVEIRLGSTGLAVRS
jgi:hypothetical protein